MAVDLLDFAFHDAHQAFSSGLQRFHSLLHLLSEPSPSTSLDSASSSSPHHRHHHRILHCSLMADATISEFRRASSLLSRSGHARFRRAPPPPPSDAFDLPASRLSSASTASARVGKLPSSSAACTSTLGEDPHAAFSTPPASKTAFARVKVGAARDAEAKSQSHVCDPSSASVNHNHKHNLQHSHSHSHGHNQKHEHQNSSSQNHEAARRSSPMEGGAQSMPFEENSMSTSRRFGVSSVSNDDGGSVVNPKKPLTVSRLGLPPLPPNRKRPSSSQHNESEKNNNRKCKSQRMCHCAHNRSSRNRRIVKMSACGMNPSDIPADEFSWKKIGHKSIHGSPYPRNYYKCDSVKGCPARKVVERSMVEAEILIITYDGEHNH